MKRILIALLIFMTAPLGMAHATGYGDEKKTARDFVNLLEANNLIIHDQAITWTVQQITDRLANHIKEPVYTFKVYVVKDRSVNAFSIPDGDIFINLGLLLFIQDLDELSAVIGHEMVTVSCGIIPKMLHPRKRSPPQRFSGSLPVPSCRQKTPRQAQRWFSRR